LGNKADLSGGHNVDPTVTKIRRSADVPVGQYRIKNESGPDGTLHRCIECNPVNAPNLEQNARLIASEHNTDLKARLEELIRRPIIKDDTPRDERLATDYPRVNRGAMDGRLESPGAPPPVKPPLPPAGTPPSSDPPPQLPNWSYKSGSSQVLLISQAEGMSTIQRQIRKDGKVDQTATAPAESWNRRDLIYGIRAELETERLVLREMTEADAGHLVRLGQNPNVTRYLPEPQLAGVAEALRLLQTVIFPQYVNRVGRWAVVLRETGEFMGWCGLKYYADVDEYDLGYRFFEEHWGHGYATEAARAVLRYGIERWRGARIVGKAIVENLASRRVLEKIGLTFESYITEECGEVAVYSFTTSE
jgi:RimJ/RimL family protein N-acetyltransferase